MILDFYINYNLSLYEQKTKPFLYGLRFLHHFLLLINKYIKNGEPMSAVNIPAGISFGKKSVLPIKSLNNIIIAPIIALYNMRFLN